MYDRTVSHQYYNRCAQSYGRPAVQWLRFRYYISVTLTDSAYHQYFKKTQEIRPVLGQELLLMPPELLPLTLEILQV